MRHIAPQSATFFVAPQNDTWRHLSPQSATIRHVAQKFQMNVFRSIKSNTNPYP